MMMMMVILRRKNRKGSPRKKMKSVMNSPGTHTGIDIAAAAAAAGKRGIAVVAAVAAAGKRGIDIAVGCGGGRMKMSGMRRRKGTAAAVNSSR